MVATIACLVTGADSVVSANPAGNSGASGHASDRGSAHHHAVPHKRAAGRNAHTHHGKEYVKGGGGAHAAQVRRVQRRQHTVAEKAKRADALRRRELATYRQAQVRRLEKARANRPRNLVLTRHGSGRHARAHVVSQSGGVSGTVTDAATSNPVDDGHLCVDALPVDSNGTYAETCAITAAGAYTLSGLAPDSYQIFFDDAGGNYASVEYNGGADVAVAAGATTASIDIALGPGGALSGTITDAATGNPVGGICVNSPGGADVPALSTCNSSDGTYILRGLAPGTTTVTFYDSSSSGYYETATASATVVPGSTTPHVDAALTLGGAITGTLTAADTGNPPADSDSWLATPVANGSFLFFDSVVLNADGTYRLRGVPAGPYTVEIAPVFSAASSYYLPVTTGSLQVTAGATTPDANASAQLGGKIGGKVATTAALPNGDFVCVAAFTSQFSESGETCQVAADGTYVTQTVPAGNYEVEAWDSQGYFLPTWYQSSSSFSGAQPVSVQVSATTSNIDLSLTLAGMITGHLTNAASGQPATDSHLCVTAETPPSQPVMGRGTCTIGSDGSYSIGGLATGTYILFVSDGGGPFIEQYYGGGSDIKTAQQIVVTAGSTSAGIDVALTVGGTINGTITDASSGNPVTDKNLCVDATPSPQPSGPYFSYDVCGTAADGTYSITGIPTGSYAVRFTDGGHGPYVDQYYDSQTTEDAANSVAVTAGNTTAGIDAALHAGGSLSGTVTVAGTGAPAANVTVIASGSKTTLVGQTASDGTYKVGGLPADSYTVSFSSSNYVFEYYDGVTSYSDSTPVVVTAGGDAGGIDAQLTPAATISGVVTDSKSSDPINDGHLCVSATGSNGGLGTCSIDPSGGFVIRGLSPGSYRVWFSDNGGDYISQYYNGVSNYSDATLVDLTAGQAATGIDASMVLGASISGTIRDKFTGAPVSDSSMCAWAEPTVGGSFATDCTVGPDGKYEFSGLVAGTYKIEFSDGSTTYVDQYYDHKADYSSADPVQVASGDQLTGVDADLTPRGQPTTTDMTVTPDSSVFGQGIQFSATVTSSTTSDIPTGTVTFRDGPTVLATSPLASDGTASFDDVAGLPVGDHTLTATYSGSSEFATSISAAKDYTVAKATTTTGIFSSANPSTLGDPVTFTATVAAVSPGRGIPSGNVVFSDGASVVATVALDGSAVAKWSTSSLIVGDHTITADYAGDQDFDSSTSSNLTQHVRYPTTTGLAADSSSTVYGQEVSLIATVAAVGTSTVPDGSVTFAEGSTNLGSATLDGTGKASLSLATLSVGAHQITAKYDGTNTFANSTSTSVPHSVTKAATTVTLQNPSGQITDTKTFTETAIVAVTSPGAATPTGSVTLTDGGALAGTSSVDSGGQASFTVGPLSDGVHHLVATYAGDAHLSGSSGSGDVTVGAEPAGVTATVVDPNGAPISGAELAIQTSDGTVYRATTDSSGVGVIQGVPDGSYNLDGYKPGQGGYSPNHVAVSVSGGAGSATLTLTPGGVATASVTSHPMTPDEMTAAGIDPNDPANENSVSFSINLAFAGSPTISGYIGSGGFDRCPLVNGVPATCSSPGHASFNAGGYGITMSGNSDGIVWLIMPGSAKWLKEFFDVQMMVTNLANGSDFVLDKGSAALTIPDGLTLAPTAQPQTATQTMPDIASDSSQTVSWILRGDAEGEYPLVASYDGSLEPFGDAVHVDANAANPLHVWGLSALKLTVDADATASERYPYHVTVGLENVADVPVYDVSFALQNAGIDGFIFQPLQQLAFSTDELDPADSLSHDFILVPTRTGDLDLSKSFLLSAGGSTALPSVITSHPTVDPPDTAPAITAVPLDHKLGLEWDPVPGATSYQVFSTPSQTTPFGASPTPDTTIFPAEAKGQVKAVIKNLDAGSTAYYAVSSTIDGVPTMVHPLIQGTAGDTGAGLPGVSVAYDDPSGDDFTCGVTNLHATFTFDDPFFDLSSYVITGNDDPDQSTGTIPAGMQTYTAAPISLTIPTNLGGHLTITAQVTNVDGDSSPVFTDTLSTDCETQNAVVVAMGLFSSITTQGEDALKGDTLGSAANQAWVKPDCSNTSTPTTDTDGYNDQAALNACDGGGDPKGNLFGFLESEGFDYETTLLQFSYQGADVSNCSTSPKLIARPYTSHDTEVETFSPTRIIADSTGTAEQYLKALSKFQACWQQVYGRTLQFTVIGHSLGGYESLALARVAASAFQYTGLITGIVSVDGALQPSMVPMELKANCFTTNEAIKLAPDVAQFFAEDIDPFYQADKWLTHKNDADQVAAEIHAVQADGIRVATVTNHDDTCLHEDATINDAANDVEIWDINEPGWAGKDQHAAALKNHLSGAPDSGYPLSKFLTFAGYIQPASIFYPNAAHMQRARVASRAAQPHATPRAQVAPVITTVTVETAAGKRIVDGLAVLIDSNGLEVAGAYTDASGNAVLTSPPGEYTLVAASWESTPSSQTIDVTQSDSRVVVLDPGHGVEVRIKDASGTPVPDLVAAVYSGQTLVGACWTNPSGECGTFGLSGGSYQLELMDPFGRFDLVGDAFSVDSTAGDPRTAPLQFTLGDTGGTPTPTPTVTPTATPTPTPTLSPSPSPTATLTPTPSPTATGTGSPTPTHGPESAPTLVSGPTVSGDPRVGGLLTCSVTYDGSDWYGTSWLRDGRRIAGRVSAPYRPTASDYGHNLSCEAAGENAAGWSGPADSASVRVLKGRRLHVVRHVVVSGVNRVGSTLTARRGRWSPVATRLVYQWVRNGVPIRGARSRRYRLTEKDAGVRISLWVKATRRGYRPGLFVWRGTWVP